MNPGQNASGYMKARRIVFMVLINFFTKLHFVLQYIYDQNSALFII